MINNHPLNSNQLLNFKLKASKNKIFGLFLFVAISVFGKNNSFAQDFDTDINSNLQTTKTLAPTSTIIKGKLFAYHYTKTEDKKGKIITKKNKLEANLTVRNLRTQEKQTRVFSPDTTNGSYFMFLLPDERYEISVQVNGFRPYVIVLFVPAQTFIYELNRDIIFEPIMLLDNQIGQHNFFETRSQNITNYYDSAAFHNYDTDRFEVLRELIDYTIAKGNIDAFDSLERITVNEIKPQTPVQYVSSQTDMSEEFKPIFAKIQESFSHGSWEYIDEFYAKQSTGNTYYSTAKSISTTEKENQKTIITHFVVFDGKNAKRLTKEQKGKLKQIAKFLNNDPRLGIEIFGRTYSSTNEEKQEDSEKQLHKSSQRTKQVFNYLKRRVDDKSKFHYIVYGMSEKLDDAVLAETIQDENQNKKDNATDKEELILTQLPPKSPRVELVISLE